MGVRVSGIQVKARQGTVVTEGKGEKATEDEIYAFHKDKIDPVV